MKRLTFTISIKAPKNKVWKVLWSDETYRKWTSAFSEGSHAVSDWQEGSEIWFLDSNINGMFSKISKIIPQQFISFTHLGVVLSGQKQVETPESKQWKGAKEEYQLLEDNGITNLSIDIDVADKYLDYFNETVPKALDNIKKISES